MLDNKKLREEMVKQFIKTLDVEGSTIRRRTAYEVINPVTANGITTDNLIQAGAMYDILMAEIRTAIEEIPMEKQLLFAAKTMLNGGLISECAFNLIMKALCGFTDFNSAEMHVLESNICTVYGSQTQADFVHNLVNTIKEAQK